MNHQINISRIGNIDPRVVHTADELRALGNHDYSFIKKLIWIYFLLLIFEGALRKWLLPGLATPLLVIRDPLALLIVLMVWQRGLMPVTPYLFLTIMLTVVALFSAMFFGHGNLWVAIYGARIFLIHFPLIFAIGKIFTRDDVIKIGRVTLWLTIPMAILIMLQFFSPQSSFVNRGVGGNLEGSGFSGALGYFRPSGTFSFTNGTALFFQFAATFIIFFWLNESKVNRVVLLLATLGLLAAIPLSISRSLFFGVGVSMVFLILALSLERRYIWRTISACIGVSVLCLILSNMTVFSTAMQVFSARMDVANTSEGGLEGVFLDRYLGGMLEALGNVSAFPFFGYGLGLGTNVGSMLTRGEVVYLISEGEWGRLIGELGPLMGLAIIAIRVGLCIKISLAAYAKVVKGDLLPWILASFGLLIIPQGQWGQPTNLGFSVLVGGLMLASLRIQVSIGEKFTTHK